MTSNYFRSARLSALVCAWYPARIAATDLDDPQSFWTKTVKTFKSNYKLLTWQCTKYKRDTWSLVNVVLKLRHIWHVTYSMMYFRRRDSMYYLEQNNYKAGNTGLNKKTLGTNFPLITNLWFPSIEPSVPSSAIINWKTCSALLLIILHISWKLTHRVFFVPTIIDTQMIFIKSQFARSKKSHTLHKLRRFHRVFPLFRVFRVVLMQEVHGSLQQFIVRISGRVHFH